MIRQSHFWAYIWRNHCLKGYMHSRVCCSPVSAQFTLAETGKQPKCPSAEEQVEKMWYRDIQWDVLSHRNEIMLFAATRIDLLEITIVSKISQRVIPYDIAYMWNIKKWYKWTHLKNRSSVTDVKYKLMICCACLVSELCLTLPPSGLQSSRLPCPSLSPRVCSTHVHWGSDIIQPSHPLSSPSPALNFPQH